MPSFTPLVERFLKSKQEPLPGIELPSKRERREKKKNGRWAIVILFFLTILASLFFYLKAEWPRAWEKITSPAVVSTLPENNGNND